MSIDIIAISIKYDATDEHDTDKYKYAFFHKIAPLHAAVVYIHSIDLVIVYLTLQTK